MPKPPEQVGMRLILYGDQIESWNRSNSVILPVSIRKGTIINDVGGRPEKIKKKIRRTFSRKKNSKAILPGKKAFLRRKIIEASAKKENSFPIFSRPLQIILNGRPLSL